ncbi:unnamed protein product [Phytophthora lilii]|uniref:Unnamed protein product n=1 Tax=Phytophthora lilii TaxID=2077276 RepID=A0A9W6TXX6_9STRA|nr:unnamed protein product [Phytophthora lilii]
MSARNREAYIFRRDGNVPVRTTSDTLWQREADVALNTKGQHLLILWQFVQHLSVGDIGPNTIGPSVRSCCLRVKSVFEARLPSVGARLEGAIDSFLHDLFGLFSYGYSATDLRDQVNKNSHPAQEGIIASLVAHVFLRSVSSRRVYNLVRSACTVQNASIGKDQLHDRFVSLVLSLYDTVHDELVEVSRGTTWAARQNQESSVSALVDGVLSLVYSEARYCALRPAMSALLMGQQTPGSTSDALNHAFQVFMAQIREAMIAGSTQHHGIGRRQQQRASESTVTASESMCGSGWNHLWLIKPASIELVDVESERVRDCRYDLCLVSVMQLVSELGCVDLHLDDAQTTLSLRSALPLSNDTYGTRMELVLDGRLRVFRVLPSGVSSMIPLAGGWCVGDYAAALASDRRSVSIDMFGFTEEKVTIFADRSSGQVISQEEIHQEYGYRSVSNVRRVRLSIELDPEFCRGNRSTSREASVKVHGTVSSSTYRPLRSSPTQEWFKLSEMLSSRRAAIWNELDWRPLLELQAQYQTNLLVNHEL